MEGCSWVEEVQGQKNLVSVHGYEQKNYELPVKEIHHVQLPSREIIHHNHISESNRQTIQRIKYEAPGLDDLNPFTQTDVVVEKQVLERVEVPRIIDKPIQVDTYQVELDPQPVYINVHFHPCTSLSCPASAVDPKAPFSVLPQPLSHYTPTPRRQPPLIVQGLPPSDKQCC